MFLELYWADKKLLYFESTLFLAKLVLSLLFFLPSFPNISSLCWWGKSVLLCGDRAIFLIVFRSLVMDIGHSWFFINCSVVSWGWWNGRRCLWVGFDRICVRSFVLSSCISKGGIARSVSPLIKSIAIRLTSQ